MRSAAVGFQCPSCVSEGAKQTRSGRTAYGGLRSANPALTSQILIGINVAVWIAILATGRYSSQIFNLLALQPRGGPCEAAGNQYYPGVTSAGACSTVGGDWVRGVSDGAVWQLVTSAFTHVEPFHILMNMLLLYLMGPQVEVAIGRARFLALYLGSALFGSAVVYWFSEPYGQTLGASGAVFGLIGALVVMAYKVRADVRSLLIYAGVLMVYSFVRPGISWEGHLGGLLGGLALMGLIAYAPRERRAWWQLSGFVLLALLLAVLVVVRTSALT
jgi:membrane associated rhomboid family serine protease